MIEVKGIVKRYGGHTAVDHISFTMEKGRIYGFLGPNGAGKSITMNIMTGYIAASEGTVSIEGFDILKKPEEAKKHIGYLPELPPLYQDMTVLEYLRFVTELKRVPKAERRDQIARVLKMTMLGDYQGRLIRNLSKGYKQRVGLAQALIGSPEVIILDEPTVGLDPQQILEIRDLLRSLKEDHIIMLSSHILSEVNEICDEVMILSHGHLVASGTPQELEKMMDQSVTVKIVVLGNEDALRAALEGVEHIAGISCVTDGPAVSAPITPENLSAKKQEPARTETEEETARAEETYAEEPQEQVSDSTEITGTDETAENKDVQEPAENDEIPAADETPAQSASEQDAAQIRVEIARAIASAGLPVLYMNTETHSLEEVFLELTGSEGAQFLPADMIAQEETDDASDAPEPEEASDGYTESAEEEPSADTQPDTEEEAGEEAAQ